MRLWLIVAVIALAAPCLGCGAEDGARSADGPAGFADPMLGVSGSAPAGWHRSAPLTNLSDPREILVLATYPLRSRDGAGECAPRKALDDLPSDGAFVWLLEYRPSTGDVWAGMPRERFPPKPAHFGLDRADLEPNISCHDGPGYRTTFRAADRPFDLFVAFGKRAPDSRIAEVDRILDSLRFAELPSPPPDPYAGWSLVNDESGDSLRVPPQWHGAAAPYRPGETPRPRLLLQTSNHALAGRPAGDDLVPTGALADLPPDGVVVLVVEEARQGPGEFPAIGRDWPARSDFTRGEMATEPAPELKWLHAQGSFAAYRFTVWIGRAAEASERDLALAFKSAASLALSGCWRDDHDPDCPES